MLKHYQDPRYITSAALKRKCSVRVYVNNAIYSQANSLPLATKTYQAVPLPKLLQQDSFSSSYTTYPILTGAPQYRQNVSTIASGMLYSVSQDIKVS